MKETATHIYFWGKLYSQWYECEFTFKGNRYKSAEQFMMWSKAMLFKDYQMAEAILKEPDPKINKEQGRDVQGYVDNIWKQHRLSIVIKGNYLKFSQNPELKEQLLASGNKILVEGSPKDDIWGVKLHYNDVLILDKKNWRGLNLLGIALMEVREKLQKEVDSN